mgnify:CR=1 FL=1
MSLTVIDWLCIAAALLVPPAVGLLRSSFSHHNISQYFLAGRKLPWWLAGTSMVATTFAVDTPLVVTGLVAVYGITGNWLWWNAALGSTLTVVLFSKLWRRANVMTDLEFLELRYSGRGATVLRGLRSLYLGLLVNSLIIGWVNLAMSKVLTITLGWNQFTAVFVCLAATGLYSAASGLRGVVIADFIHFSIAMVGTTALALFVLRVPAIGGIAGLLDQLPASAIQLWPDITQSEDSSPQAALLLPFSAFAAYLSIQWWASWYPGQEPGGGGYIAQRMMSTRGETDAVLATLWFTLIHYCVRPWPWIVVALASLVLYPNIVDPEAGYVFAIRDHLPIGWRGLVIGAFIAAYISTVSTQLNWGSSYLINDFYKRFVQPKATEAHLVGVSRVTTLAIMCASAAVTFMLDSIRQAWEFMLESGAGIGLVLILRWYWWRITAVTEIAALIASAGGFIYLRIYTELQFPHSLIYLVPWTTACWLTATFLTRPDPMPHLARFFERVRPAGAGWSRVAAAANLSPPEPLFPLLAQWLTGSVTVYLILAGAHAVIFNDWKLGILLLALGLGGVIRLVRVLLRVDEARCP